MKHLTIYDDYDFLGMQAAANGMTREEWMAAFGSQNLDEQKNVMTFEAYVSYDDMKGWGNPSDIEEELKRIVLNLFKYADINDNLKDLKYTDQSSDKGIKWQIDIKGKGNDIIHAYKDGSWRGQYEWYLNKKKSSEYDIQQYFLNKYVSDLDQYIASMKAFDYTYQRSDDHRKWKAGSEHSKNLETMYSNLSNSDKKKAHKAFIKHHKSSTDFNSFSGN